MTETVIRPATLEDIPAIQTVMNKVRVVKWLGSYTYRGTLEALIERQIRRGTADIILAEREGVIIGTSESNDKTTFKKMGFVSVEEGYRDLEYTVPREIRSGIGTALYTAHAGLAMLACKLTLQDHIHFENEVMKRFLPTNSFTHVSTRYQNSRNLANLETYEFVFPDDPSQVWLKRLRSFSEQGFDFSPLDVYVDDYVEKGRQLLSRYKGSIHPEGYDQLLQNQMDTVQFVGESR